MSLEELGFEFDEFFLDAREKVLLRHGKALQVTPKALQLLLALVENHGHIVEKSVLMDRVWPDSFVEESNLTFTVPQLRKVLGDDKRHPVFIETIPRRGYRFIGRVKTSSAQRNGYEPYHAELSRPTSRTSGPAWRSVILSITAAIAAIVILSAGFLLWRSGTSNADTAQPNIPSPLKFETIVSTDQTMTTAISPDGKYVAYTNNAGGQQSLWLRQMASGINTQLLAPGRGTIFGHLEFSSSGEYVYFTSRYQDQPTHLDRVSILGGVVKENILTDVDGAFSISPDDSHISFRRYAPRDRTLFVANIDGSDIKPIYETSKTFTDNVFSPDGRLLAFATGQSDTGTRDYGVNTIDLASGEAHPATDHKWFHVRSIAWLPDGSGLFVTARMKNDDPHQIWKITLPTGEVSKVTDTQDDLVTLGLTADLTQAVVMQLSLTSNLYRGPITEPDSARAVAHAHMGVAWSPNGDLVFSSSATGNADIWLIDAKASTQKQLTTEVATDIEPVFSPDGRFIVFVSDRGGKYNLWRMNPDGSDLVQLTNGDGETGPAFAKDGQFVLFNSINDGGLWQISLDASERRLISNKTGFDVSISPDGKKLAHFAKSGQKTKIVIASSDGESMLREFDTPTGYFASGRIVWTDNGRALLYAAEDSNLVGNLWQQSLDGQTPRKLTNYNSDEIFGFDLSLDGLTLAVIRGTWNHNIVLVKGLEKFAK